MTYEQFTSLCASRKPAAEPDALIELLLSNHENCLAILNDENYNPIEFIKTLTVFNLYSQVKKFQLAEKLKLAIYRCDAELLRQSTVELASTEINPEDIRFFVSHTQQLVNTHQEYKRMVSNEFNANAIILTKVLKKFAANAPSKRQHDYCHPDMEDGSFEDKNLEEMILLQLARKKKWAGTLFSLADNKNPRGQKAAANVFMEAFMQEYHRYK